MDEDWTDAVNSSVRLTAEETYLLAHEAPDDKPPILLEAVGFGDRRPSADRSVCKTESCYGVADLSGKCLIHLHRSVRHRLMREARWLDLRGVRIGPSFFQELRDEAGVSGEVKAALNFDGALIEGDMDLSKLKFTKAVSFRGCGWTGVADFSHSSFAEDADFVYATFDVRANFEYAKFGGTANFSKARFGTRFDAHSYITATGRFIRAEFVGMTWFDQVFFAGSADFPGAVFRAPLFLGPMVVSGQYLSLSEVNFVQRSRITASAVMLWLDRVHVELPAILAVREAEVSIQNAKLDADTQLEYWEQEGYQRRCNLSEDWLRANLRRPADRYRPLPRILAVRGTPLSRLTLRDTDLRACRFSDAIELDRLTLHGEAVFPQTRATGRLQVADELLWREAEHSLFRMDVVNGSFAVSTYLRMAAEIERSNATDAAALTRAARDLSEALPTPSAHDVEGAYRALRKRSEDLGHRPGADDFYYGEMQIRRWAPQPATWIARWTQKLLVTIYWLVAGYGLRAWRPALALALLIAFGGLGLQSFARHPTPTAAPTSVSAAPISVPAVPGRDRLSTIDALYSAAELSVAALSRNEPDLVYGRRGRLVRLALVILGPAFLAMIIVALRARLRRST